MERESSRTWGKYIIIPLLHGLSATNVLVYMGVAAVVFYLREQIWRRKIPHAQTMTRMHIFISNMFYIQQSLFRC